MAFSPKIKYEAYKRANGRCECTRKNCKHNDRCPETCLIQDGQLFLSALTNNYSNIQYPGFEFHHKIAIQSGGEDTLSNCEFLCKECHINTQTYGSH